MTSIRQRLTRRLLLTLAALIVLGALAAWLCARAALLRQFDAALRARADTLIGLTEQHEGRVELEAAEELLRDYAATGPAAFQLSLADGSTLFRSPSLGEGALPRPAGLAATPQFYEVELTGDRDARALALTFTPRSADAGVSTPVAPLQLVVALDRAPLDHTLATLQLVLGTTGIALLVAVAVSVPLLLRRELQPLAELARQAASIDARSLHARFPEGHLPAELAPVAARLNELLSRLEAAFEREHRFTADAAHEFRTPLAELRALAELSLKLPDTRTPQTDADVLVLARHLESITTRLLALARGDHGELAAAKEPLALPPLLEKHCAQLRPLAESRGLTLVLRVPAELEIHTDPALFRAILINLTDNALAYSRAGTALEIEAARAEAGFVITVSNTPLDLTPADLPRLFERFWRKDPARAADGHAGLGLALAQTFADGLRLRLTASFDDAGRVAFTLRE